MEHAIFPRKVESIMMMNKMIQHNVFQQNIHKHIQKGYVKLGLFVWIISYDKRKQFIKHNIEVARLFVIGKLIKLQEIQHIVGQIVFHNHAHILHDTFLRGFVKGQIVLFQ